VHTWLNPWGNSAMWEKAVPGYLVTVTAPGGEFSALADPDCGGCWEIGDVGLLEPGDAITVKAGSGVMPVDISIPDPFMVAVDPSLGIVSGEIGGWSERPVEILGTWPGGTQMVNSDTNGNFSARGKVIIDDMVSYAVVVFLRPFQSLELVLDVNYAYDTVSGLYEPGHTIWVTVTDDLGAVKAQAVVETNFQPEWEGKSGFSTENVNWVPLKPDIVPGDWVIGLVDNAHEGSVQAGMINGNLDFDEDQLDGSLSAHWISENVEAFCEVWEEGGPKIEFIVDPDNGSFSCDFQTAGWDLRPEQIVAVTYFDPGDDRVTNIFSGRKIFLPLALRIDHTE